MADVLIPMAAKGATFGTLVTPAYNETKTYALRGKVLIITEAAGRDYWNLLFAGDTDVLVYFGIGGGCSIHATYDGATLTLWGARDYSHDVTARYVILS